MELINKTYTCKRCQGLFVEKVDKESAGKSHFRFCPECRQKNIKESVKRAGARRKKKQQVEIEIVSRHRNDLIRFDRMAKEYGISYGYYVALRKIHRLPAKKHSLKSKKAERCRANQKPARMDGDIELFCATFFGDQAEQKAQEYGREAPKRYMQLCRMQSCGHFG